MSDSAAGARAGAVDESGFERVASLAELEPGVPTSVESASLGTICIGIVDGDVVAFVDRCAHREFPLSAGEILEDGTVECPWHGARFDCRTGAVVRGPADRPIAAFEARVDGDDVLVRARRA